MTERRRILDTLQRGRNPKYRVPSGYENQYTQVSYIESHGSEYIDTGINGSWGNLSTVRIRIAFPSISFSGAKDFFGASNTSTMNYASLYNSSTLTCYVLQIGTYIGYGSLDTLFHTHEYDAINKTVTYDGAIYQASSLSWEATNTSNFTIFKRNVSGKTPVALLLESLYLKNRSNVVVADFIPVIRASDSAIGLLDISKTTPVFKGNNGSGTFEAGPAVQKYL